MLYKGFQAHPCSDVRTLNIVTEKCQEISGKRNLVNYGLWPIRQSECQL